MGDMFGKHLRRLVCGGLLRLGLGGSREARGPDEEEGATEQLPSDSRHSGDCTAAEEFWGHEEKFWAR